MFQINTTRGTQKNICIKHMLSKTGNFIQRYLLKAALNAFPDLTRASFPLSITTAMLINP
jgi:hypothetical protein